LEKEDAASVSGEGDYMTAAAAAAAATTTINCSAMFVFSGTTLPS